MKPVLAITVGDPAGIGPEITLKSLLHPEVYRRCIPVVIGDGPVLQRAAEITGCNPVWNAVAHPEEAKGRPGTVDFIDTGTIKTSDYPLGRVSAECGEAAFACVVEGIRLAMSGAVQGVVTGPINKEALNLAGHHFSGHTEIFAEYTGTKDYAMLLVSRLLRVIHVTTHVSMREACDRITKERVLHVIRLADRALKELGLPGAPIAVAGLNPHSGENGLFGDEEITAITPAIEAARSEGIVVEGPLPPDTVFVKAIGGQYAIVVCMYHDQGHIPLKLSGFRQDPKTGLFTSVNGVNCTIGLPIVRSSVDHGTAFDRAGSGTANEESLLDAIEMAATMVENRFRL